jgi:uncharacterized protein (TIGR00251 family)
MDFLRERDNGVTLSLRVKPGAARTSIIGEEKGRLIVRVSASPVEGKANRELISFLAKKLDIPKSGISFIIGRKGREKVVLLSGLAKKEVEEKIKLLLEVKDDHG